MPSITISRWTTIKLKEESQVARIRAQNQRNALACIIQSFAYSPFFSINASCVPSSTTTEFSMNLEVLVYIRKFAYKHLQNDVSVSSEIPEAVR